uniref:Uncharacterized protein n=1 Tax=Palpitomonas bilix TaxID=652834 RepID=A0A7S3G6I7_9EUKA|mmetsp:Transcript_33859/g.86904  ORF Transcript_33859/g.86904 Transcript_33859/m.86904 type:complete len:109 (+) Transcript_33859:74-400(+)
MAARTGGSTLSLKLVLLGEGRVGKTSICLRYVNNSYTDKQVSTIQASFLTKKVNYGDCTANLAIWDTAGQERFHALGPIYYRDADGNVVSHDDFVTYQNSLHRCFDCL